MHPPTQSDKRWATSGAYTEEFLSPPETQFLTDIAEQAHFIPTDHAGQAERQGNGFDSFRAEGVFRKAGRTTVAAVEEKVCERSPWASKDTAHIGPSVRIISFAQDASRSCRGVRVAMGEGRRRSDGMRNLGTEPGRRAGQGPERFETKLSASRPTPTTGPRHGPIGCPRSSAKSPLLHLCDRRDSWTDG